MAIVTSAPPGMRDFLPAAVARRRFVMERIREVYRLHGFVPLETPSMERLEVLLGKYGEEGDQLIFRVMKRGEALSRAVEDGGKELADFGLRYDLTVPLARVVAEHASSLPRPFKRYQMQPVWRADRPQRGRLREFYQCDVDFVGSRSLVAEYEVISAVTGALGALGFTDFRVRVNERRILSGLVELLGLPAEQGIAVITVIDKLDKIGLEGVQRELATLGVDAEAWELLASLLKPGVALAEVAAAFAGRSPAGEAGCANLEALFALLELAPLAAGGVDFDLSLARGLSYYTGPIFEIALPDLAGSVGGGGRYDGLIGMFGKEEIPAVGFALGFERIMLIMEERGMFPELAEGADLMVSQLDGAPEALAAVLAFAKLARSAGLSVEVYPEVAKLPKQFKHAESIGAPMVAILGLREAASQTVGLRRMGTGEQVTLPWSEAIATLKGRG
jgi:histidyl-tRNA synthetase